MVRFTVLIAMSAALFSASAIAKDRPPQPSGARGNLPSAAEVQMYMREMPHRLLIATQQENGRLFKDTIDRLEFVRRLLVNPSMLWYSDAGQVLRLAAEVCTPDFEKLCDAYTSYGVNTNIAYLWNATQNFATTREDLLPSVESINLLIDEALQP